MTATSGRLANEPDTSTLPKLLRRNAEAFGQAPGIREKHRGVWRTYSWQAYRDNVRDLALGLAALGFRRGDKLSVVGDNRPCLYWAQLAAQALGGVAVPAYQDAIASELVHVLDHAEVSVIVAEDQEQVDKILSLKDRLPRLRSVIFDDPRGLGRYREPMLQSGLFRARAQRRARRRCCGDRLHLGNDGATERRPAQPPQPRCHGGELRIGREHPARR
jgi:long-chain acyl-CoA synthetase